LISSFALTVTPSHKSQEKAGNSEKQRLLDLLAFAFFYLADWAKIGRIHERDGL
jgi:hypothetical protein